MDQSSTPWRVFDTPGGSAPGADATVAAPPGHTGAPALANQRLALAGVAGAIAVGGVAVLLAIGSAGGATIEGPVAGSGAPGTTEVASREIVVDVGGAVVTPGVYRLAPGARVGDAINAAGGFGPRVDVDRVGLELNLAAALTDGAQIRVPSRDDPAATSPGGAPGGGGPSGGGTPGGLVNLNTASQSDLEALPGIGPATAGKILESRAGSAFRTVDELRERGLVGEKTFEKLKPLVTVG